MKLNASLLAASLVLFTVPAAVADETVTLTWKKSASEDENNKTAVLTLGEGESAKAVWAATSSASTGSELYGQFFVTLSLTKGGETYTVSPLALIRAPRDPTLEKLNLEIAGPAIIRLKPHEDATLATFSVKRVGTASPPAEVPQEAGSNFDVILEQSSDLVNWTPANPGAYSGTETKRFFRTRIVKKQ